MNLKKMKNLSGLSNKGVDLVLWIMLITSIAGVVFIGSQTFLALFEQAMGAFDPSFSFLFYVLGFIAFVSIHVSIPTLYAISSRNITGKIHKCIESLTLISLFVFLAVMLTILYPFPLLVNSIVVVYLVMSCCTVILFCIFVEQYSRKTRT